MNFSHLALNWLRKITLTSESFFKCLPLKSCRQHFSTLSGSNNYFQSEAVSNGLIDSVLCSYNAFNSLMFKMCLHLICGSWQCVERERERENKNERKTERIRQTESYEVNAAPVLAQLCFWHRSFSFAFMPAICISSVPAAGPDIHQSWVTVFKSQIRLSGE